MSLYLIAALGLLTYLSRAAAVAFLPPPSKRLEAQLKRVPAPLFASFAALTLLNEAGRPTLFPAVVAVVGALAVARFRSLLIALAGGLAGYAVAIGLSEMM